MGSPGSDNSPPGVRIPQDPCRHVLTTTWDPGWWGLVLEGHTEVVPGAPNLTTDLKIFGAESRSSPTIVRGRGRNYLPGYSPCDDRNHPPGIYRMRGIQSAPLRAVIHLQLGSLTQIAHDNLDEDNSELQESLHVLSPIVTAYTDRDLEATYPLIAPYLQMLLRLQK